MSVVESININKYAEKYADVLSKLYNLCQFVLNKEIQQSEQAIEYLSEITLDTPTKYNNLSEVFLSTIRPIFEQIRDTFLPGGDFNRWDIPAHRMYPIIQSSIVIFCNHLSKFQLAVCKSIRDYQTKIEKYHDRLGIAHISKGIVIIDKNSKINYTNPFENNNNNNTPIELISVYSKYLVEKLKNKNYSRAIAELASVSDSIKDNMKNFNSIKAELTEIKSLEIHEAAKQFIIFKDLDNTEENIFSEIFNDCNRQCNILETGKGTSATKVKEINLACNLNLEKMFESLTQDLSRLNQCSSPANVKSETSDRLKEYLDSIQTLTDDTFSYINYHDLEMQQKFNKIMTSMNSELIGPDDTISHLDYLPKLLKEVKILDVYIDNLDLKMNHERRLALYYQQLESIDKSLLKLMTETIMKNDLFIHNFIKFKWLDLFQKCTVSDAFGDFNRKLSLTINPNYLLSIGSINNRIMSQFYYKENNSNFFENRLLLDKVSNEYYNGLTNGLGGIIRTIITEMLSNIKKFDSSKPQVSVDLANNKISVGKQQMTQNHFACFCTINYQNSPLVLMNYTIDYLITYICINFYLNKNDQKALDLFEHLINYLNNEPYSELTSMVYARWVSWICVFAGKLESQLWESNLKIKIINSKIKDIAIKHLKNYLKSSTEINIKLVDNAFAYQSSIDQKKVDEFLNNPKSFPDKQDFLINSASARHMFSPVFDNSSMEKELELLLIILNKFGKLSCISIHHYAQLIFSPIEIKSNELTLIF